MLPTDKGYDFDSCLPTKYWDDKTRIEFVQRRILVFSIMYYNLSDSCITDNQFNCIAKQLVRYIKRTPLDVLEQTKYWYVFKDDFDGSTGFDLYYKLNKQDKNYLTCLAKTILNQYNNRGKNNGNKTKRLTKQTKRSKDKNMYSV